MPDEPLPVVAPDKGKCATCGFLALRVHAEGFDRPLIQECGPVVRANGSAYGLQGLGPLIPAFSTEPCCVRGAVDFRNEIGHGADRIEDQNHPVKAKAKAAFNKPRACRKWWPYRFGLDPQWHLDERRAYMIERLRKEQREWFHRETAARERYEAEATRAQTERINALAERERKRDRRQTIQLAVIGFAIAILCIQPDSAGWLFIAWIWSLIQRIWT